MIETIIPSLESGPYSLKISRTKLTAADEENILTINTGITSTGMCKSFPAGASSSEKESNDHDARKIPIEKSNAIIVGEI